MAQFTNCIEAIKGIDEIIPDNIDITNKNIELETVLDILVRTKYITKGVVDQLNGLSTDN